MTRKTKTDRFLKKGKKKKAKCSFARFKFPYLLESPGPWRHRCSPLHWPAALPSGHPGWTPTLTPDDLVPGRSLSLWHWISSPLYVPSGYSDVKREDGGKSKDVWLRKELSIQFHWKLSRLPVFRGDLQFSERQPRRKILFFCRTGKDRTDSEPLWLSLDSTPSLWWLGGKCHL